MKIGRLCLHFEFSLGLNAVLQLCLAETGGKHVNDGYVFVDAVVQNLRGNRPGNGNDDQVDGVGNIQ